eukprot:5992715-Prymnesium_polylepis.1
MQGCYVGQRVHTRVDSGVNIIGFPTNVRNPTAPTAPPRTHSHPRGARSFIPCHTDRPRGCRELAFL